MRTAAQVGALSLCIVSCSKMPKSEVALPPSPEIESPNPAKQQEGGSYFKCLPVLGATEVNQLTSKGLTGTYKFVLQQVSQEDVKVFGAEANKWGFGALRLALANQESIFLTSPTALTSIERWRAEVSAICDLDRPKIQLFDYQFNVADKRTGGDR